MDPSLTSINILVPKLKNEMFSQTKSANVYSFVSPSAYDTAWLALVNDPHDHDTPLFNECVKWLLENQTERGFWGESVCGDSPTIDALPATLVCITALQKWGIGSQNIEKGLKFIHANMEEMLNEHHDHLPRWFVIVFPATVELAESLGLEIRFSDRITSLISQISDRRQQLLCMESRVDKWQYPPLMAYLETFQSTKHSFDEETITKHLSNDGSLFQSPSATAQAYMSTGNHKCLEYLTTLVRKCPNGVPHKYPIDEELVELSMVDQLTNLGLSEYFTKEIETTMTKVYRSYTEKELIQDNMQCVAEKLFKDSLAFRLFRLHGHNISPRTFCWFLYDDKILQHLENNCQQLKSVLYNVYKATDFMFFGETEVDEARSFSKKMLQKISTMKNISDDMVVILPDISEVIDKELSIPWIARLDHLDHRMWIEQNKEEPLWIGKASFYRLSYGHNPELMQLAVENYSYRQLIYQNELMELKRWSRKWGLTEMGFGREKTMYCYYLIATSTSLPRDCFIRKLVAKCAIVITIADDFFDTRGSLEELHVLTEAIHKWNDKGLKGPSKVIFSVLDDLVTDTTKTLVLHGKYDVSEDFRDLWREIFMSWLTEATWGKSGYIPSMEEYMETGMVSIAAHILVLMSSCFLNPSIPKHKVKPREYENITLSLMATTRLLNDIQSYQKEQKEGKHNLVLLHFKENPNASIDDSINEVKRFLDWNRKEFLKHVFSDNDSEFPNKWKHLHLSCFKVFQMLFNSDNLYDTDSGLKSDIEKAIYIPPKYDILKKMQPKTMNRDPKPNEPNLTIRARINAQNGRRFYGHGRTDIKSMKNIAISNVYSPMFRVCFF